MITRFALSGVSGIAGCLAVLCIVYWAMRPYDATANEAIRRAVESQFQSNCLRDHTAEVTGLGSLTEAEKSQLESDLAACRNARVVHVSVRGRFGREPVAQVTLEVPGAAGQVPKRWYRLRYELLSIHAVPSTEWAYRTAY